MKKLEYLLAGVLAAMGALFLEIILDFFSRQFGIANWTICSLVIFVAIEESAKISVVWKKISFTDSLSAILINCFWIGLGFGLLELGLLFLNKRVAYAENISAVMATMLVHIITALLTGLFLAKLKDKSYWIVLAVIPALILHSTFNYWTFGH